MVDSHLFYKSNSDNLKAEDIGDQFCLLTIASAFPQTFEGRDGKPDDTKIVLTYYEIPDKKMPLNKTNWETLVYLYGPETDNWINQQVTLYTVPVKFDGKLTKGLRVRAPQQAPQQPLHPAPRPVGALQPGMPHPRPTIPAALQNSPQRPLNPPQTPTPSYAQQSGYSDRNPPPPRTDNDLDDEIPF